MKPMLWILDMLLRVAAGLAVPVICLLAWFVGGMAGPIGLLAITLPTMVLSVWIVLCALSPSTISRKLPDSTVWRFVLVKLPVYAVACVAIYGGVFQWSSRYGTPSVMVGKGDRQFPLSNPNPTKKLEISGTLPLTVPVKDLLAIYTADVNSAQKSSEACTRREDRMPKNDTERYPLVHIEHIPMVRAGELYRSAVAIDRFNPGLCGWHLKAVTYLLDVKGYSERDLAYRRITSPHIELIAQPQDGEPSNRSNVRGGRADVWCWKQTNHEYNPFLLVRCGAIKDALTWPGQHVTSASMAERESTGVAYAGPESSSVEFNFHDFDAPPSQLIELRSQAQSAPPPPTGNLPPPPTGNLPPPARLPSQFAAPPTQGRESQPPANVEVGAPVNISVGESLEDVQAALGTRAPPEPTHSAVHANAQSLTVRGSGVRVFFDESKKVYTIRIDAPFTCKLGGRELVRTREELDRVPGAPAKQIQALSNRVGSSFISDIDATTRARYDFDAAGRVTTVFLLSGTLQVIPGG
jgi:hypothetical protein